MNEAAPTTDRLSPIAQCRLAERLWWEGDRAAAERDFRGSCARSLAPESHILLGGFLIAESREAEAIESLRTAWELAKSNGSRAMQAESCLLLSRTYERLENSSLASQFTQLAIAATLASDDPTESALPKALITRGMLMRFQQITMGICRGGDYEYGVDRLENLSRLSARLGEHGIAKLQRSAAGRLRRSLELLNSEPLWN